IGAAAPSRGVIVRTVLVCVRSPSAARSIEACAAGLGVSAIRTASSDAEAMARLTERPAELILADTMVTRADPVGFTRRLLDRSPGATVLLFGDEDPRTAAALVAAGVRGVIRGGERDPVAAVAKALLLIGSHRRGGVEPVPAGRPSPVRPAAPGRQAAAPAGDGRAVPVPAQRGDGVAEETPVARLALTDRELQVLRRMAEGKSNAEIGRELYVSEDTVKTHARRLFRKLGVRDRAHAVAVGFRAGALA